MRIPKSLLITIIVIVVLILVAGGVWLGIHLSTTGAMTAVNTGPSPYSAVYLSTGAVYFGKLDWYPTPHMEDAWFLQQSQDAKGNPTVGVYPFTQVAWGPTDVVYFNSSQIVFWTQLAATSSIAQLIENPSAAAAAAQQAQSATGAGQEVPAPTASTTIPTPSH